MRLKYINIVILILDLIVIINLLNPIGLSIGFPEDAGAIGIIGGADGPTTLFIISHLIFQIPLFLLIILNVLLLILNSIKKAKGDS